MITKHDVKLLIGLLKHDFNRWLEDYQTVRELSKRYPKISPFDAKGLFESGWADVDSDIEKAIIELGTKVPTRDDLN